MKRFDIYERQFGLTSATRITLQPLDWRADVTNLDPLMPSSQRFPRTAILNAGNDGIPTARGLSCNDHVLLKPDPLVSGYGRERRLHITVSQLDNGERSRSRPVIAMPIDASGSTESDTGGLSACIAFTYIAGSELRVGRDHDPPIWWGLFCRPVVVAFQSLAYRGGKRGSEGADRTDSALIN